MPEQRKDNVPLVAMFAIGALAVVIGLAVTGANAPDANGFDPVDPGLTGAQMFGIGLASFGGVLLVMGWAVAAILHGLRH